MPQSVMREKIIENDDTNLTMSESARRISKEFGFKFKTCEIYLSVKRQGFESMKEYRKHLAKQKGFSSHTEYLDYLARQRGFSSCTEYLNYLAKKDGFTSHLDRSAKKQGFKSQTEYLNHLAKQKGFESFGQYKEYRVIMRGFSSLGEYNYPPSRQRMFEQRKFEDEMEKKGKEIEELVYSETPFNSRLDRKELQNLIDELMKELPDRVRTIVYGIIIEGKTSDYFAKQYGCSGQNILNLKNRALEKLRRKAKLRGLHLFLEAA